MRQALLLDPVKATLASGRGILKRSSYRITPIQQELKELLKQSCIEEG